MRGDDGICGSLFSYIDLEKRVRADHPLRVIRQIANAALKSLSGEFAKLYSPIGRGSIPPERLMRALLLQAFYSIRSERQLVERIDYDLLFRWFVGLGIQDAAWDATSFTKNRDRLLDGEVASKFLTAVLSQEKVKRLLSSDHFSVDGTLLEAWASAQSFQPKDGSGGPPGPRRNGERDFRGERRRNDTHASTSDPDARLFRKGPGKEARLCFMGHALMENRNGLIVGAVTTRASGHAERPGGIGADRTACRPAAADHTWCRQGLRRQRLCHGTAPQGRHSPYRAEPERAPFGHRRPHHPPFRLWRLPDHPQTHRGGFGWAKTVAGLRKSRHRGLPKVDWNSPWRWPPMIWSACPNCSTRRHDLDVCSNPHPAPFSNPNFARTNAP
jgi:transposase